MATLTAQQGHISLVLHPRSVEEVSARTIVLLLVRLGLRIGSREILGVDVYIEDFELRQLAQYCIKAGTAHRENASITTRIDQSFGFDVSATIPAGYSMSPLAAYLSISYGRPNNLLESYHFVVLREQLKLFGDQLLDNLATMPASPEYTDYLKGG